MSERLPSSGSHGRDSRCYLDLWWAQNQQAVPDILCEVQVGWWEMLRTLNRRGMASALCIIRHLLVLIKLARAFVALEKQCPNCQLTGVGKERAGATASFTLVYSHNCLKSPCCWIHKRPWLQCSRRAARSSQRCLPACHSQPGRVRCSVANRATLHPCRHFTPQLSPCHPP